MEKRETLIKGGETDTEWIGGFLEKKKHTDSGEEKREQREGRKKKERKNRKHARRLKKERERRKRKGEHVKNREKKREKAEKIDSLVLLSTLNLKLRSKKLLERRLSFLKNAGMICKV